MNGIENGIDFDYYHAENVDDGVDDDVSYVDDDDDDDDVCVHLLMNLIQFLQYF